MSKLNVKRVCIKDIEFNKDCFYIGRGSKYTGLPQSILANPYKIGQDGTREEVVQKYRCWLWEQIQSNTKAKETLNWLLTDIKFRQELGYEPLKLVCWCKEDEKCHGDIIIRCLNWMEDIVL